MLFFFSQENLRKCVFNFNIKRGTTLPLFFPLFSLLIFRFHFQFSIILEILLSFRPRVSVLKIGNLNLNLKIISTYLDSRYTCMYMHRGKTIFSFRLAKRNTQDSRVFLLANLKLKEGYSKSKVWLFRLGFVVRAFLPHGCADLWLTLLRLMDVLIHGLTSHS